VVEALADLAEHRGVGHAHVLEGEQRGVEACMPSFSSFFSRITPGRVHRHEEEREAVVAGVGSVFVTSTITSARWPLVM
jgi:hypothetical protein